MDGAALLLESHRGLAEYLASFESALPEVVEEAVQRQSRQRRSWLTALPPDSLWSTARTAAELGMAAMRSPSSTLEELPEDLARLTVTAARQDVPLSQVLQPMRTTHAVILDRMIRHAGGAGTDPETLRTASRHLFWFIDSLLLLIGDVYREECRSLASRRARSRYASVKALLAGAESLPFEYPLERRHVALVVSGPQVQIRLRMLLEQTGMPYLAVSVPDGCVWVWMACDMCEGDVVKALREQPDHGGGMSAGVSGHEPGVEGFRATHRKAQLALRLGRRRGSRITTFGEVALEALAFGGERLAREFVATELGSLSGGDRRVTLLRQTLVSYFASASAGVAARNLGVSERTVTYRLRHAEHMLDRPITVRRAELETALRLHDIFERLDARATVGAAS